MSAIISVSKIPGNTHTDRGNFVETVVNEVTPAALSARRSSDDDELFVLDVQPEEAYEEWHVPGSENIDIYDELRDDPEAAREALSTIPDTEIILTCTAGVASEKAAEHLKELGYDVETLVCHYP